MVSEKFTQKQKQYLEKKKRHAMAVKEYTKKMKEAAQNKRRKREGAPGRTEAAGQYLACPAQGVQEEARPATYP